MLLVASEHVLTVKHSIAVLGGGWRGFAGRVQLVTVVADADLKLDRFSWLLEHARTVEHGAQRVLPLSLVLLLREGWMGGKSVTTMVLG